MAAAGRTRVYVGLDDTDTLDAGGTGRLARSLATYLAGAVLGSWIEGVSRHQLLQDPRVPCTRRNRCSCLVLSVPRGELDRLRRLGRAHIVRGSVPGSDPGYCV